MKFVSTLSIIILVALLSVSLNGRAQGYSFEKLLKDSRLKIVVPEEFDVLSGQANKILAYEYALAHTSKKLAVRYAIRPISMVSIDYDDPHNAAPEPNYLFAMLFQSLVSDFSRGGNSPTREYSRKDAQEKFNADWAAAAVLDVTPEFSRDYDQLLLLAIHKNNAADAYIMVLFDDYHSVKQEINLVLASLKFQ